MGAAPRPAPPQQDGGASCHPSCPRRGVGRRENGGGGGHAGGGAGRGGAARDVSMTSAHLPAAPMAAAAWPDVTPGGRTPSPLANGAPRRQLRNAGGGARPARQ
ncbi:hypothetical protein E2C01_101060 [Portunus trituberculatus]|uniref:Uncharacterized protein n=1 Tax=Portunus trituberculatus TaxID=210409 RepID=A0A5B7K9N4_PORTR|nr:hypothetical protein [Portunus trituberculatus]